MNTKLVSGATLTVLAAASLLALSACSREADHASRADSGSATSDEGARPSRANYATADYGSARSSAAASSADRDAEVRKAGDGKPLWASNRQRSGEENAQKQFERNGADFSAASLDAYVKTAHAFVDSPPKGALTVARRNGDVLYYDPKANIFAVADREGAPRTMFKPRDGMSYWLEQKQSASDTSRRRESSRTASRDDRGSSGGGSGSDEGGEG